MCFEEALGEIIRINLLLETYQKCACLGRTFMLSGIIFCLR